MAGQVLAYNGSVTTSGGTGSISSSELSTLHFIHGGFIKRITITPSSNDTVYNVVIISPNSRRIYEKRNLTGRFMDEVNIPVRGTHTFTFSSVDPDDSLELDIDFKEEKG